MVCCSLTSPSILRGRRCRCAVVFLEVANGVLFDVPVMIAHPPSLSFITTGNFLTHLIATSYLPPSLSCGITLSCACLLLALPSLPCVMIALLLMAQPLTNNGVGLWESPCFALIFYTATLFDGSAANTRTRFATGRQHSK
jgi:hypothetical protein